MTQAVQNLLISVDSRELKEACGRIADAGKKSKKAEQSIKEFGNAGEKSGNKIKKSIGQIEGPLDIIKGKFLKLARNPVIALAALTAGAVTLTKSLIDSGDAIDKSALFSNVSTDRIQTLTFALGQMGIESGTVETALRDLNKNVGEFTALGSGPAKEALDKLGLSSKILSGELSTNEEVFDAAIVKLEGVESQSERTAIANKLFGEESGSKLAGALSTGAQAIFDLEQQMVDMGAVIEADGIAKAVAYKDRLSELSSTITGKVTNAFWDMVPSLEASSNAFNTIKQSVGVFLRVITLVPRIIYDNLIKVFDTAFNFIADGFDKLGGLVSKFLGTFGVDVDLISLDNLDLGVQKLEQMVGLRDELDQALNDPISSTGGGLVEDGVDEVIKRSEKVKVLTKALEDLRKKYSDLLSTRNQSSSAPSISLDVDTESDLIDQQEVNTALSIYEQYGQSRLESDRKIAEQRVALEEETTQNILDRQNAINQGLINAGNAELARREEIDQAIANTADKYLDGFIGSVLTGQSTFKEFANAVIADIARIAIKKAILGAFDGLGGGDASTGFGGVVSGISSLFRSNRGNVVSGNQVHPTAPTTLAENGAEAILPLQRDANGNLGVTASGDSGGSSISNNISVTVNVGSGANAEEISQQAAKTVEKSVANIANQQIANAGKAGQGSRGVR